MAQYTVNNPKAINAITGAAVAPNSFTVGVPDEGQVFRATGDYGTQLYMRRGNQILSLDLLHSPLVTPGSIGAGNQAGQVKQGLAGRGLNYDSLPEYNIADLGSYGKAMGLSMGGYKTGVDNPIFKGGSPSVMDAIDQYIQQNNQFVQGQEQQKRIQSQQQSQQATAAKDVTANAAGSPTGDGNKTETPQTPTQQLNDTLKNNGVASSFSTRSKVASAAGIKHYVGTSEQNSIIMQKVQSGEVDFKKIDLSESPSVNMSTFSGFGGMGGATTPSLSAGAPVGDAPGSSGNQEKFINDKSFSFFRYLEGGSRS